jgi:hypothetical protein
VVATLFPWAPLRVAHDAGHATSPISKNVGKEAKCVVQVDYAPDEPELPGPETPHGFP